MTFRVRLITMLCAAVIAVATVVIPWAVSLVSLLRGPTATFPAGNGPAGIVVSPDGRTLYAADDASWTGRGFSSGHTVTSVSLTTGRAGHPIDVGPYPGSLTITPDGRRLFVLTDMMAQEALPPEVTPVNLATGRAGRPLRFPGGATGMVLSPDGRTLYVSAGVSTSLIVPVDVATGREGAAMAVPGDDSALAITPDGRTLYTASGSADRPNDPDEVIPVDLASGRAGTPIPVPDQPVALAVAPDGRMLYVLGNDNDLGLAGPHSLTGIDVATARPDLALRLGPTPVSLVIAPDSGTVYIRNDNDTITPVSTATGTPEAPIHTAPLFKAMSTFLASMAISPDGRTLYAVDNGRVAAFPVGG